MISVDDFLTILRDHIGLDVTGADLHRTLDEVDDWDSVHLLALLTIAERIDGRQAMSLPAALEATTLHELYLVVAP